ncbi:MAG: hypothetical protein IJJ41_02880 [Clostridia bacterium]|nr:hypothetical protein [Clostridia bacterium]MBR0413778.1 hypothetical protein [Clostridia bacterium]
MMKQSMRKVISIILALVMLLSVFSVSFYAFAENEENDVSTPGIQMLLTDGEALKAFLEGNFLSLETFDKLLSENMPALSELLCSQLGDLFYQMGYAQEDYPTDRDGLVFALARAIGSLGPEVFKEPEKIETTDLSLIYNLAYLGGTQYVEDINAKLPAELRFDTSTPVIDLTAEQQQEIREYYKKWQAGALRLDNFDVRNYIGDMHALDYFKIVLLCFIADDARLPAITEAAIDFILDTPNRRALANAVATILDNFEAQPVSAVLQVISNSELHPLLKELLQVANKVTVRTDYYSYKIFQEGIYKDTDGSVIPHVKANDDGTYSYVGPSMVSAYLDTVDALLALFDGMYGEMNNSMLESLFSKRSKELAALAQAALQAASATVGAQQAKLTSDIESANIEIRFANQKIAEIDSGAAQQAQIARLQSQLDAIAAQIAENVSELDSLEKAEALAKDAVKGYYEAYAEFEEQMTPENQAEIESNPDYIAAKAKVKETEDALAENYARQAELRELIAQRSAQADTLANQIDALQNNYVPEDAKAVYNKMISTARQVISDSEAALAALPAQDMIAPVSATLASLIGGFFAAFDGVYDKMMNESPLKALIALLYGLKDFVAAVEAIDWDEIASVTDPLFAQADEYINSLVGRYIGENGGSNILADLSEMLNGFLDTYGVYDYINVDYLNSFISQELLGDNSQVMQIAANALQTMFPDVQPTYESIVSCLIPVLSAFNFSAIMSDLGNITAALSLASPSAFAYLAGLNGSSTYLNTINANLASYGYEGEPLRAMISLSSTQQSNLMRFVEMEQNGTDLASIAAAGFNWKNYTGGVSNLALANAFVKIALGDSQKLGEIAATPGLGTALTRLLCDLLNDIKTKPVDTLLKKLSDSSTLAAIADFALGLLNGEDANFKSYDMFFTDNIYYDGEGNTTFYDMLDEEGVPQYTGPKALEQYVPIIGAAIDFLSNIYQDVNKNNGDLLKTLLYDKTPQLKQLIKSAICYTGADGSEKAGMLFYLLMGYGDYLKVENEVMCYDVLISLAEASIREAQAEIEGANAKIAQWNEYLMQAQVAVDAAKLTAAKEAGIFDESVTVFDQEALETAIAAKEAALEQEIGELAEQIEADAGAVAQAQADLDEANTAFEAVNALQDYPYNDPFYSDLCAIFDEQDLSLIDTLRDDCADDFDATFGEGKFEEFVGYITDYYEDYEGDGDTFIDDWMLADGIAVYTMIEQAQSELDAKQQAYDDAAALQEEHTAVYDSKSAELQALESGTVLANIQAAGEGVTIAIDDGSLPAVGDYSIVDIEESIQTIRNEKIAGVEEQIAEYNTTIDTYRQEQKAASQSGASFNPMLVPLATRASDVIAQGLINVIMGDKADGSENIYVYIMNHNIVDILTTGGRWKAIFEMIFGIYEPALQALVSEGILDETTAEQLIAATPDFTPFYEGALADFPENFKSNPVGALGEVIQSLTETIKGGFAQVEGDLAHDVLQMKKVNSDVNAIFDDTFSQDWLNSYSKCVITRAGEIYQFLVDLLGLSFIKELLEEDVGTTGELSGKIDTSRLYADVRVSLYKGDTLIATVEVKKNSDGAFTFTDVDEGRYTIRLETAAGIAFEVKAIDVIADDTTDLTTDKNADIALIELKLGDVDGNNVVDVNDVNALLLEENFGSDSAAYDINCDGTVDFADLSIVLAAANYGAQAESIVY